MMSYKYVEINLYGQFKCMNNIQCPTKNHKCPQRFISPHLFDSVFHTLDLALKNICAAKNIESNLETYIQSIIG